MKKGIITCFILIIVAVIIIFGVYLVKANKIDKIEKMENKFSNESNSIIETIETDIVEEKITPNTKLVLKKYYSKCNHSTNTYVELPKEFVNLGETELIKKYPEWKIEKFSKEEVVLLKEENSFCNKHYLIKEKEGQIAIYKIKESGEEILKDITNISVEYLPESDLLNLKSGIRVYGEEELNKTLEDYE